MIDRIRKAMKRAAGALGGGGRPAGHELELMRRCRGDRRLAERLMAAELERAPSISRAEASRRAVARLVRDQ